MDLSRLIEGEEARFEARDLGFAAEYQMSAKVYIFFRGQSLTCRVFLEFRSLRHG